MSRLYFLCRTIIVIATVLAAGVALADRVEAASLRLGWSDNSSNESGFKIERRAAGGSYAQLTTVGANVTSYTDSGLTSGRTYCYIVRAFNSAGTSVPTKEACATTASTSTSSSTSSSTTTTTSTGTTGSTSTSGGSSALTLFSDNRVFVSQQYLDFLDRAPDSVGFAAWVNALNSGFPKAGLIESFMDSGESRIKGKFIAQTYLGIFSRDAGHNEFRDWLGALLQGMSREQIVQFFLNSDEFKSRFGSGLTNRQFVERMYNNILLRSSDYAGLNGWVWALNNGQVTRAQVALSFLDSDEFQNLSASQNRVDIALLYFDMLRRDPDAGGFSGWVEALNSGVPLTSAIDAFLMSREYQAQFCNCVLQ